MYFQMSILTCFLRCISLWFYIWGRVSRCQYRWLSLAFGVKFLGKHIQRLIIWCIVIIQRLCKKTKSISLLQITASFYGCSRLVKKKQWPFFFVSADFFGGPLKGFFAALDAPLLLFMRGSLSELSSEFKYESDIEKYFKATHSRHKSVNKRWLNIVECMWYYQLSCHSWSVDCLFLLVS